ncbi:hypothetical protein [Halogeometricum limi]|uniref:Uncharacterized protein n=1 Tax=Halogeometricum limi TaxID=555875 RepID=A0A1I6GTP2_9EURY|nr:hypothetical protein [Halogeometricum limi]SFR45633.1 hypothetical protein SAMN04488124_1526 [Halogeometricum limi]
MERLDDEQLNGPDEPETTVAAHQSSRERTVFTEKGNRDAWISLDTESTVDLSR